MPKLGPGDEVLLVAPSRFVESRWVNSFVQLLVSKEIKVTLAPNLFARKNQFAGTDQQRLMDMQWAIDHPNAKAIWSVRGGYGAARILPHLDFSNLLKHPKWMVGYSDFSVFHCYLNGLAFPSLHATMPVHISDGTNFISDFERALCLMAHQESKISLNQSTHINKVAKQGLLIGGNLSILYSALFQFPKDFFENKILFLEDVGEYLYHIDRMVQALESFGVFENISGLLVGSMTDMNDNPTPFGEDIQSIFESRLKTYTYPRVYGLPCGHNGPNHPLILGQKAYLTDKELLLGS